MRPPLRLQIASTHEKGLDLRAVAPRQSGPGFELLMLYRTRVDPPTGMLSGILLEKVRDAVETGVRESLKNARARTESASR